MCHYSETEPTALMRSVLFSSTRLHLELASLYLSTLRPTWQINQSNTHRCVNAPAADANSSPHFQQITNIVLYFVPIQQ